MYFLNSKEKIPSLEIIFDTPHRKTTISVANKRIENEIEIPLFTEDDLISGKVKVSIQKDKNYKHSGIQIELICNIEPDFDECKKTSEMFRIKKDLESAGDFKEDKIYQFSFEKFEKPFESYYGSHITLRYFLRVSMIGSRFVANIIHEKDFAIQLPAPEPKISQIIAKEGGIEDCLYIEHSYDKDNYHLKDCIVGQIYFSLIRIKILRIELFLVRREIYMPGHNAQTEEKIITKIRLADNCPRKGDMIPFRCYLGAFNLTPSFRNNMVSVKYYLNMVLVDDDDRRYPQRTEICLWRKS